MVYSVSMGLAFGVVRPHIYTCHEFMELSLTLTSGSASLRQLGKGPLALAKQLQTELIQVIDSN